MKNIRLLKNDGNHKKGKVILVSDATAARKIVNKTGEIPVKAVKKAKKTTKKKAE